ncbi:MAG: hypothetical protein JNL44_18315, partial [Gemmatimonadetes bacterium]|nr:hypothetical protein [Gemmatimonadota bacterium]
EGSRAELLAAQVAALQGDRKAMEAAGKALQEALSELGRNLDRAIGAAPDESTRSALRAAQPVAQVYSDKSLAAFAALQRDATAVAAVQAAPASPCS